MKFLLEVLPVVAFVLAYFFYPDLPPAWGAAPAAWAGLELTPGAAGDRIYFATAALMAAMPLQCLALAARGQLTRTHLAALALVWAAGGLTLLLRDPLFIKWKPTAFYWLLAAAFLASAKFGAKTLVERMMSGLLSERLEARLWRRLNAVWVGFFALSGALNLYVAYAFPEEFWVQFKLFGLALGLPALFVLAQGAVLAPHLKERRRE